MKIVNTLFSLLAMISMLAFAGQATAKDCAPVNCGGGAACASGDCGPKDGIPCPQSGPSTDCIGALGPNGQRYLGFGQKIALTAQDHYSPDAHYAYSSAGLDATRMDYWNRNYGAPQYSWHGNYNHWKYGQPTALVVPPTASFQTEYNWGVGQTRSMPIDHQFNGGANAGPGVAGGGRGMFRNRPYWPSSTSQFGIYPVRGPW